MLAGMHACCECLHELIWHCPVMPRGFPDLSLQTRDSAACVRAQPMFRQTLHKGANESVASELEQLQVRYCCGHPTHIAASTPEAKFTKRMHPALYRSRVSTRCGSYAQAFPHAMTADDVANPVVFLASDQAAAITGHNLVVDCGILTGFKGALLLPAGFTHTF